MPTWVKFARFIVLYVGASELRKSQNSLIEKKKPRGGWYMDIVHCLGWMRTKYLLERTFGRSLAKSYSYNFIHWLLILAKINKLLLINCNARIQSKLIWAFTPCARAHFPKLLYPHLCLVLAIGVWLIALTSLHQFCRYVLKGRFTS